MTGKHIPATTGCPRNASGGPEPFRRFAPLHKPGPNPPTIIGEAAAALRIPNDTMRTPAATCLPGFRGAVCHGGTFRLRVVR